ncbi:CubicO group peptidase, beta-lactamase class C family [Micromonospora matsumotoense]|uniref:CubicO group peptidase, beta-lactamase class C family n=1 Tax=Micromonospora matsumotoense TaxID=121616 RepID=A0A1C4Z399_9ACTN|nr:serine hydrolase domain-containing protein [Micromonospora matsumotoense]SCF27502.1 CubicO group peptidase, beta-lactamase class C family [Micromonospora matsumotoense]
MVRTEILVRQGEDFIVHDATRTRYQLASVSKQFTAAAVLLLVQDGRLLLDDVVGRWIDGCPEDWRDITLHQLLTHTSGLGHWDDYPMIDLARWVEPDELLKTFHRVPLRYPPGGGWSYSSPAYVLLAHVVERVADTPYRVFLADRLFGPLGLTRTFAGTGAGQPDLAPGHDAEGRPLPTWELDVVGMGAGDVWSTAEDVLTWTDALQDGRLLGEPYRTLMLTERARTGRGPEESGYGYGVFVGEHDGRRWWHHSGHNAGFKAFTVNIPDLGRRVVVLSNTEATDAGTVTPLLTGGRQRE